MSALPFPFAPLPFDADPGASFPDLLSLSGAVVSSRMVFLVPGEYFYYPISLYIVYTAGAVAGNRTANYCIMDPQNRDALLQPVSATQPPSTAYSYTWDVTTGAGYGDGTTHLAAPMPPRMIEPGWQVGLAMSGAQIGDSFTAALSVIKIPRQRPQQAEPAAIVTPPIV